MNPISGTFRLRGLTDQAERKQALLDFLADEKEIYELFMVVDEELKMMCDICSEGGLVLGPYLKPMTHLVHTEYLLAGRTHRDPREVLRDSMFAATVTGSPVENACRLIARYEPHGRGYYASVLALLGRDADGEPTLDAPILIRTADVDLTGRVTVTAGATLVRDSDPAHETAETHAKAGGVLTAFGLVDPPAHGGRRGQRAGRRRRRPDRARAAQPAAGAVLAHRPVRHPAGARRSRAAPRSVLDGEDDFVNMLRHVLGVLGMTSTVVRHDAYEPGCLDGHDLVVVGPGPGRPARPRRPQDARRCGRRRPPCSSSAAPSSRCASGTRCSSGLLGLDLVVQGHRLPGDADPAAGARPRAGGRLLQHVRRAGARRRAAAGGARRDRPGDR